MTRTTLGILIGLVLAVIVAARYEGALSAGIVGGYLLGGTIAVLAIGWQRHWLRVDLSRAFRATLEGFMMKLGVALLAAVTLRFVPPAGEALDWRGFLVAYASASLLAMLFATAETTRALKESLL